MKIAGVGGDGIGTEVIEQGLRILDHLTPEIEIEHFDLGAERYLRDGTTMPKETMELWRSDFDAIYLGALGDPRVPSNVHAKDIRADIFGRAKADDMSFLDAVLAGVFTVPGDGSLDFTEFAQSLAEIDYRRWVVVEAEQDPAKAPPAEYAKIGHRHLSKVFTAAGFDIVD